MPTYDRSGLIRESIHTLGRTLIEEMVVVSLVIFLFLLHVRSALVPILTLPVAVLLAFIPMLGQQLTANIMSLGGIAVAIGAMVDASIIIVENIHKPLDELGDRRAAGATRLDVVIGAMQEVGPSIFFALLVITVSFMPVFTLEGTEGRLFKPARLHQDLRHGLRGGAGGDAGAGARRARHPRARPRPRSATRSTAGWSRSTRRWCASWCATAGRC